MHKWPHYFDIYHRYLNKFRAQQLTVVEFGVYHGGSLQMWQSYFGPQAKIIGVDIDPRTLKLREFGLDVRLGDQGDREFLRSLRESVGPIDIVLDDGGHRVEQQINTVEELFPYLAGDGIMMVEDTHSNYWPEYGGELGKPDTFMEWVKARVDDLHYWHQRCEAQPTVWATHLGSLHVHDSVVVLERGDHSQPPMAAVKTGTPSFPV